MDRDQAKTIIELMRDTWGHVNFEPGQVAVWGRYLEDKDFERSIDVVYALQKTRDWFPSIADFDQVYRSMSTLPPIRHQPDPDPKTEQSEYNAKRFFAMQHGALNYVKTLGEHKHAGTQPCRVCSGWAPWLETRTKADKKADVAAIQFDIGEAAIAAGRAFHEEWVKTHGPGPWVDPDDDPDRRKWTNS